MSLPLLVTIELVERVEDQWFYELAVMVPGSKASNTEVLVASDLDGNMEMKELRLDALGDLGADLRDRLLARLFKLAHHEMITSDGAAIQWTFSDISHFLHWQFGSADAQRISNILASFVDPHLVVGDVASVRVD